MPASTIHPAAKTIHPVKRLVRRLLGRAEVRAAAEDRADSYVGLFQGVIETEAPQPVPRLPNRASGFVRLEVSAQKKATGCFLFFVDGEVLSGAIEGASDKPGFVDASFRLKNAGRAPSARPVAAVGRLHLETRHARGAAAPGEDLTIRFV